MTRDTRCVNCGFFNEADNDFCCNCGNHLGGEAVTELRTVAQPWTPAAAPTVALPATGVPTPLPATPVPNAEPPIPTLVFPIKPTPAPGTTVSTTGVANWLPRGILIGLGVLLAIVAIGLLAWNFASSGPDNISSGGDQGKGGKIRSTSSSTELPKSLDRSYTGMIAAQSATMNLERNDSELKGSASTDRHTDEISGTIESDGSFSLMAYEDGNKFSGYYKGKINTDGSIKGTWTNTQGGQPRPFSFTEER